LFVSRTGCLHPLILPKSFDVLMSIFELQNYKKNLPDPLQHQSKKVSN
jgi:hypothetical protein